MTYSLDSDGAKMVLIKVAAMVPWPEGHAPKATNHPSNLRYKKPAKLGDTIFSLGAPVAPSQDWTCGTDVVWPIYEVNSKVVIPDEMGRVPYVCRHQIVAGD